MLPISWTMATKIPDGILEQLYCDVCYKFLSVKPVKVFPGKSIKCGRCSNNGEDEGVVSLYELIADQYYFPCVNRFDGCDILLDSSQVASHENICYSRHYVCPICEDDERIPTFLMIKHFSDKHRAALLNTSGFCIDPRESPQVEKWFLYKLENILFFIRFFLKESEDTVSLCARYLGVLNESDIITQKFNLHYGSNRTATEETLCLPYNRVDTTGVSVKMSSFKQKELISVYFEIDISRLVLSKISLTEQARCNSVMIPAQQATVLKKTLNPIVNNGTRLNASLIEMDYSEDDLIRSRVIFLTSSMGGVFSVGQTYDYSIDKEGNFYFLHCFQCGELDYTGSTQNYIATIQSNKKIYFICSLCYNSRSALGLLGSYVIMRIWSPLTFRNVNLYCIWNCNHFNPIAYIYKHEIECVKQPSRLCPVESCAMKGKLSDIREHFKEHSPDYSLLCDSKISVSLIFSKSPIKQFLMVRNNVFVYLELTWTLTVWRMKFMLCGDKDTFAGMKLKAMAIVKRKVLGLVEQHEILEFPHMEKVLIKCFLEK